MRILLIHNHYLEKGGEDEVVNAEAKLLTEHGHEVIFYEKSNKNIEKLNFFKKLTFILWELNFSKAVYKEIKEIVKIHKPDIAHIHNVFVCITPCVYFALKQANVPIVQTLHNYRFFCLKGTFFNKGKICEKCKDKRFFNAIAKKCWRNSFILSLFLAKLLYKIGYFLKNIDSYIVLSEFSRNKFIEYGLNQQKMYLKRNFLDIEPYGDTRDNNYAVFIGRLVDYKGIETLLEAFRISPSFNLKIIGDGPMSREVRGFASSYSNIEWLGKLNKDSVFEIIKNSSFLIFPSECYETMGMVILESFVFSKPVLAGNLGAVKELVIDGVTGILFESGKSGDLAAKVSYLFSHNKERIEMGKNANKIYRERFNKQENYQNLMNIYTQTIKMKKEADKSG